MNNQFLRHLVATIDYRFQKSVQNSSDHFGNFSLGKGSRSPIEIINHMFQVLRATRTFIQKDNRHDQGRKKLDFLSEVERFKAELIAIDELLSKKEVDLESSKKLIQGPLSDIVTHIGQIALLQRLDDRPILHEDFSKAPIKTGL